MMLKMLLLMGFVGHAICCACDRLLTFTPNGRFRLEDLGDDARLAIVFDGMPLRRPMASILLGVLSMGLSFWGYFGLYLWMKPVSAVCARVIIVASAMFFIPGVAHHVICGAIEWFYIRLGRTGELRRAILEFFRRTSVTMAVCYVALLVFSIAFFIPVVSGATPLPRWACVFNLLPLFAVLAPLRVVGAGNIAGAVMFAGLFFLI